MLTQGSRRPEVIVQEHQKQARSARKGELAAKVARAQVGVVPSAARVLSHGG